RLLESPFPPAFRDGCAFLGGCDRRSRAVVASSAAAEWSAGAGSPDAEGDFLRRNLSPPFRLERRIFPGPAVPPIPWNDGQGRPAQRSVGDLGHGACGPGIDLRILPRNHAVPSQISGTRYV